MGASCDAKKVGDEKHCQDMGLIPNHAYSLMDVQDLKGTRFKTIFFYIFVKSALFLLSKCLFAEGGSLVTVLKSTIVRYFVRSTANLLSVVFQKENDMF